MLDASTLGASNPANVFNFASTADNLAANPSIVLICLLI
jgi:hypothetical protein